MRFFAAILIFVGAAVAVNASDASGRIVKVLPLYLDLNGHDAISPSLFDRDAYQAELREQATNVSAIRFDILWKTSATKNAPLKLRAELRGVTTNGFPRQTVLETNIAPHFFRHWTSLKLEHDELNNFGSLVAWRVTILNGDKILAEQKSFLW